MIVGHVFNVTICLRGRVTQRVWPTFYEYDTGGEDD